MFWGATIELCAEMTFARVRGIVSVWGEKKKSVLFFSKKSVSVLLESNRELYAMWFMQVSLSSQQH